MLEEVMRGAEARVSDTMAAAPLIMAMGKDWEAVQFQRELEAKRAHALFNLISTLKETEDSRVEFLKEQQAKAEGAAQLSRLLGI